MHVRRFLLFVLLLPLLAGCDPILGSGDCTGEGHFAISLSITDAATDAPAAAGASVFVRNGEYEETHYIPADRQGAGSPPLAFERDGLFTVRVEKTGYQPWERNNIRVRREGRCQKLVGVSLTARLQPL